MLCRKHPHSSPETAAKCFSKEASRKSAKLASRGGQISKYRQVKHDPPAVQHLQGGVIVYVFFSAEQGPSI